VFKWHQETVPETLTDIQRAARFYYLQQHAFGGKVDGQTFGTATTAPSVNLLRIEGKPLGGASAPRGRACRKSTVGEMHGSLRPAAFVFSIVIRLTGKPKAMVCHSHFEEYERMASFMRFMQWKGHGQYQ